MYICICHSVTDANIREAVDAGVRNLRQLKAETGCGAGCGTCIESVNQELAEALADQHPFLRVLPAPFAA